MKSMSIFVLLIMVSLLLSGCWDHRELNELGITLAGGIDKSEQGYTVTVQTIDPSQMGRNRAGERSPVITYASTGTSINEILAKLTAKLPRESYGSHMRFAVISEQAAKAGLTDSLDFIFRNFEMRPDFYLVVAKGYSAQAVLSMITPFEIIPAMDFYKSLKISERLWAPTAAIRLIDLLRTLRSEGREPVLTAVTLQGDVDKARSLDAVKQITNLAEYRYDNLAIFRKDRMLGWLNENESKAYNYINNKVVRTVKTTKCPRGGGMFSILVTRVTPSVKPLIEAGCPIITVTEHVEGNIREVECKADLTKERTVLELEKAAEIHFEDVIHEGISGVQEKYGSDIFGFGEAFYRHYPRQWKEWRSDWDNMFRKLSVRVHADVKLKQTGRTVNQIGKKE
ncbi:Ger(x)C family spore germination protein [Paenibacillus cremeus]|uniref:Ger(X)C family spore germination protein n=1 Tax=Paenibacillus cremeus TaxID=2163881 RepID=A0A559KA42_9BACL|nr:Ger(x)C family spore germination protein [Paenibacillus cremeus]TVY09008.1 Ger(x)C family spore germination protein [Paenibacillus cremeus]